MNLVLLHMQAEDDDWGSLGEVRYSLIGLGVSER